MMMVMAMGTRRLSQILYIRKLAGLRSVREVRRKLVELVGGCCIALRLGSLGGVPQVRGDLSGDLLVLGRIRLLELLQGGHQLSERRKLAVVNREPD